jgi:hypothetical protein
MNRPSGRPSTGDYPIGYGKPPGHTRFRPGVSGNPQGRPRGVSVGRADRLALKEIYRLITVREGEQTLVLPTVQAIVRQLGRLALKGNGPALRAYFGIAQATEQRLAMQATIEKKNEPQLRLTEEERVDAIMAIFNKVKLPNRGFVPHGMPDPENASTRMPDGPRMAASGSRSTTTGSR